MLAEKNQMQTEVLRTLFRLYGGIWENLITISEWDLSEASQLSIGETRRVLTELRDKQFIDYYVPSERSHFVYTQPRVEQKHLHIPDEVYTLKQKRELEQIDFMQGYALTNTCKETYLLDYFNDSSKACDHCQSCLLQKEVPTDNRILEVIENYKNQDLWFAKPIPFDKEYILNRIQILIQDGIIEVQGNSLKKAK
jgi:ATP-dependent DNA helicase RecQ